MKLTLLGIIVLVGCGDPAPPSRAAKAIAAGHRHTCAITVDGDVVCWGFNADGQLGYGNTDAIGDDEKPQAGGEVALPGAAIAIAAGEAHTCAVLEGGDVHCWGQNSFGQLGYGNTDSIGDDELPIGPVNVGEPAVDISAGAIHTCALLAGGRARCWGDGTSGRLGYGNSDDIGDDEVPASAGDIDTGGAVAEITAGTVHTCARIGTSVRCWGRGEPAFGEGPGGHGQLGYGNRDNIGDDEQPSSAGDVDVGGPVAAISAGHFHQCALLESGAVRCWGRGEGEDNHGQLGYPGGESLGDDEPASAGGDIDVGAPSVAISAGDVHTCAISDRGGLRCWGFGGFGQLGSGNRDDIGDDEPPSVAAELVFDTTLADVVTGTFHTCVLDVAGAIRCFGLAAAGELGSAGVFNLGDDEPATSIDPITL